MNIFVDGIIFSKQRCGGINRTYLELLPRITNLDSSVTFTLYLRRKLRDRSLPYSSGIQHLFERSIYPWRWLHGKHQVQHTLLERAYCRVNPHIFHTTYFTRPDRIQTRFAVSIYDMMDEIYAPILKRPIHWQIVEQKRKCIEAADLIISNSTCTTLDIQRYCSVDERKVVTIHLGVGEPFHRIKDESLKQSFVLRHRLSKPFILFVGGRRYNKNFMGLVRAYAQFKFKQDIDLVSVGDDEDFTKEEQEFILRRLGKGTIRHLKVVTDEELVLAYNAALALVFPSIYEGFGLPVLEAMACGTPVAASSASSIPEVGGDAALYFNPLDHGEIAAVIETIVEPGTAMMLTEKGLARAALFPWEKTARETLAAYQQLV
jgi:glycosyltransferase involved in cell wall biosynthesis